MTQNTIYVRNTKDKEKKPAIASNTKPFFGTPFTSLQPLEETEWALFLHPGAHLGLKKISFIGNDDP